MPRQDKTRPLTKDDVANTYESLDSDQKKHLSNIIEKLAAVPEVPMTSVELVAAYEPLNEDLKMRVSRMVRRLAARAVPRV